MVPSLRHRARAALAALAILAALAGSFAAGYLTAGRRSGAGATSYHDMLVMPPESLTSLVDPKDPAVAELARKLGKPETAYYYVRDRIGFDPSRAADRPGATLRDGAASCLGKAALLASLYRALGLEDEEVRVVTGQVRYGKELVEHAWVEIERGGRCLQQDPTPLLGTFGPEQFEGSAYTSAHVRRELFCFNDHGFAVVSQRNRFRNAETVGLPGP